MENITFHEKYFSHFVRVCAELGAGWRIDVRQACEYRLRIINPDYRHFLLLAMMEKGRIVILGVLKDNKYGDFGVRLKCTVSPERSAAAIAGDIKRKILKDAPALIAKYEEMHKKYCAKQEQAEILRGALSRLVRISKGYNSGELARIETDKKICGIVHEGYRGYGVELSGLSADDLIKIAGCLSNL